MERRKIKYGVSESPASESSPWPMARLSQWIIDGHGWGWLPARGNLEEEAWKGARLDGRDANYCRTGLGRGTSCAVPTGGESMYHPAAITALEYLQAEVTPWADGR